MTEKIVKKDWLRILSPAILGVGLSVIGIIVIFIKHQKYGDDSFFIILMFAGVFAMLLVLDFLLKRVFKYKILTIWLIELFVLGLFYWILGL